MKIYHDFEKRPSGAHTFCGDCFIKIGPDCSKESELLRIASNLTPKVLASSNDFIIMERVAAESKLWKRLDSHANLLRTLHRSNLKNPSWRMCRIPDYVAYCTRPESDSVPKILYSTLVSLSKQIKEDKAVFIHGDATLSNSIGNCLIDLSVRPTLGHEVQDWSKFLFSILGFDIDLPDYEYTFSWFVSQPEVRTHFKDYLIDSPEMAFYFVSNLIRVLRKEELSKQFLERSLITLTKFL